jgi:hypothetical protein
MAGLKEKVIEHHPHDTWRNPMRTTMGILCLVLGIAATGQTGEKKKRTITCKVGEVSDVGILFTTRPKKGESKEFMIKFEQTRVELVKGDKIIDVTPNVVKTEKLTGRIVQLQIENGGDDSCDPPKTPPKRVLIKIGKKKGG